MSEHSGPTVVIGADTHLDSTRVGRYSSEHGVHQNWLESFRRLDDLVETANDVEADVLVIAGDIWDTGRPSAEAVARFNDSMRRLDPRTAGVFMVGNHDLQSVLGSHRTSIETYIADQPWCHSVIARPGVVDVDGLKIAGMPWLRVGGSTQLQVTEDNMAGEIRRMMDEVGSGPSLLTGHLTLAECSFSSPNRGSEVVMSTAVLEAGVPVSVLDEGPWAMARLGHIHKRQQVSPKTGYVGSPYKVTFGERHEQKGCDVVRFHDDRATLEFREFDVRQLIRVEANADGGESPLSVLDIAKKGDVVRFVLDAEGEPKGMDKALRTLERREVETQVMRLPKVRERTMTRTQGLATDMAPADALKLYLDRQEVDDETRASILSEFADLTE